MKAKRNIVDDLTSEHIRMSGCPQIIVTRGFCYQFLATRGWNREKGFASADYSAFGSKRVDEPLTPDEDRDYFLGLPQVQEMYERA